jgi:hypothetical protein
MPDQEEWERDCRVGVRRVREWLASRASLRDYLSGTVEPYQLRYRAGLREDCAGIAENRADELMRWGPAEVPAELAPAFQRHGCTDQPEDWHYATGAFQNDQEAAIICGSRDGWRLLVVSLQSPDSARELVSMVGRSLPFMVASAPPDYFGWSDSPDFALGRADRPRKDVVLLFTPGPMRDAATFDEPRYAFFHTDSEWVRVAVECCREPE